MQELLQTARSAAQAAAEVHRTQAGSVGVAQADEKGRADFVSRVDIEAQRVALGIIRKRHPDHAIMAEETDPEDGTEGATLGDLAGGRPIWVVDPLDGTANFLNGHPLHCSSVGVVIDGRPKSPSPTVSPAQPTW